jgi:hypothetical protein
MAGDPQNPKRVSRICHKARFTGVHLLYTIIKALQRWAVPKEVPVSLAVEEAIAKLREELRAERRQKFQKAKARREAP